MADETEMSHPLRGMILCCTSIEMSVRNDIIKKCEDMGARHHLDLTSDVTHLVCGALFSPKYRYVAKMRMDVRIMSVRWIHAMYEEWLLGNDIDPAAYEHAYRFPILNGLSISVTGISDVADRKRIEEICHNESASYHPDLTRDVTHLIAAAPTGKKYDFARANGITVVTPEWLTDSVERGMALEEQYYDPKLPPEKIGVGAKPSKPIAQTEVTEFKGKRRIRKQTQDKLGSQSQNLWDDIVGQASNAKPTKRDEWEDPMMEMADKSRGNAEYKQYEDDKDPDGNFVARANPTDQQSMVKTGMFGTSCFFIWGFGEKETAAIKGAVTPYDGTIIYELEDLEQTTAYAWKFIVVPRNKPIRECPDINNGDITMVTEWWIEACLHHQKFVKSTGDFTTMPIDEFEVPELKGVDIAITKFSGIDLLYYPRLIKLLGANYHEVLTKACTLLITSDSRASESEKIRYAQQNNIPVVTGEWLIECLRQHKKLSYEDYLIKPAGQKSSLVLGDRFKRKPEAEPVTPSKRHATGDLDKRLESGGSDRGNSGEGKKPRISNPNQTDRNKDESKPREKRILDGCTVCVSRQLKERTEQLRILARSLGAKAVDTFDEDSLLTHLIHETSNGKARDSTRDFKIASSISGCSIVSPEWLYKSAELGKRMDEIAFPPISSSSPGLEMGSESAIEDQPPHSVRKPQKVDLPLSSFRVSPSAVKELATNRRISTESMMHPNPTTAPTATHQPTSVFSVPLEDSTHHRLNKNTSSSASRTSVEPPELSRSSSSLSNVSEILEKFGKERLTSAMACDPRRKQRSRLQGKATTGNVSRSFSRTPSTASLPGDVTSRSTYDRPPSLSRGLSAMEPEAQKAEPVPSQALDYNYEETSMEKKIVRAKLDKSAPIETPRSLRTRVNKAQPAVDLMPVSKRELRKRDGGGGAGTGGF